MTRERLVRPGSKTTAANVALVAVAAAAVLSSVPSAAQTPTPDVYFVPDVVGQFNALGLAPEPFGMWVWGHPEPSDNIDKHYQGIARSQGPGLPHMFLAWNGNDSGCIDCDNEPGQLFVIRMLSRDTTGERLRSNRLYPGHPIRAVDMNGFDIGTAPDLRDCLVARIVFDGKGDWPHYRHPGAMQIVGDVLAVPLSKPGAGDEAMRIQFIDITEPAVPSPLSSFVVTGGNSNFGAGAVALTPVRNPFGAGQRYLMAIVGEGGQELRLYRSLSTDVKDPKGASDLKAENLLWEEINSFTGADLGSFWPCCSSQSHQTINFVREGPLDGTLDGALYLIGAYNDSSVIFPGGGTDYFTLYRVNVDVHGNPESPLLTHIKRLHVTTNSIAGDTAHFTGSTGVYVSPSGELIIYANEHEEQGPYGPDPISGEYRRAVRAGEYRHRAMVRPGSPTLKPSVAPAGSFAVDEGGTVTIAATGRPASTRAWLQLFRDTGLGLSDDNFDADLVFDYDDRDVEDYDNLPKMYSGFNDEASSLRWFAPQGCGVEVDQHSIDDGDFPGGSKLLSGLGSAIGYRDLATIHWDNLTESPDDEISAVRFFCDAYYGAPIAVSWDLNDDESYETNGTSASFSAYSVDGPTVASVRARAQHATDTTALGTGTTSVPVSVRNVAPVLRTAAVTDPLGRNLDGGANLAIAGVPVQLAATFIDPGRADTQTASVVWGDGTTDAAFKTFSDARNGAIGQLGDAYVYAASGTYEIVATITDDDKDASAVSFTIQVLSIEQAIADIVEQIDALLSTATDPKIVAALLNARDELTGNHGGTPPTNGALDLLAADDPAGAITKLSAALAFLMTAQSRGAGDLSAAAALLGLAAEGIATTAYYEASASIANPSRGQTRALTSIAQLIVAGHELVANGQYGAACESFRQATQKALNLMP